MVYQENISMMNTFALTISSYHYWLLFKAQWHQFNFIDDCREICQWICSWMKVLWFVCNQLIAKDHCILSNHSLIVVVISVSSKNMTVCFLCGICFFLAEGSIYPFLLEYKSVRCLRNYSYWNSCYDPRYLVLWRKESCQ